MTVLPTFPLSQIWGVDTGIHGDDLLYRFQEVARYTDMKGGILPNSQQRLAESTNQAPYEKFPSYLDIAINDKWVGDPVGAENRRLPDSNAAKDIEKKSTGFGKDGAGDGDTFRKLHDLAVTKLPPGIKSYAEMVEPELRKLIPVETIATIEKGRELYEVAQQISASWQKLSTVNQILPFDKAPTDIKIPGLEAENNFINSSIFGGRVKVVPQNNSQISWYLNPTFSSAYQNVGANDLPGNNYV